MTIKYEYAFSEDGAMVSIKSVQPSDRSKIFTCLGCEKRLIPALGKIRDRHFRHKVELTCSGETYLHKLAKQKFYDAYTECLAQGKPFFVDVPYSKQCDFYREKLGLSCKIEESTKPVDLTKWFSEVPLLESRWGEFIPDVLLQTKKGVPLFIEIKVFHACSEEKINSGHRILEIDIDSIDYIEFESGLSNKVKYRIINFNSLVEKEFCYGNCSQNAVQERLAEVKNWIEEISGKELKRRISFQDIKDYQSWNSLDETKIDESPEEPTLGQKKRKFVIAQIRVEAWNYQHAIQTIKQQYIESEKLKEEIEKQKEIEIQKKLEEQRELQRLRGIERQKELEELMRLEELKELERVNQREAKKEREKRIYRLCHRIYLDPQELKIASINELETALSMLRTPNSSRANQIREEIELRRKLF